MSCLFKIYFPPQNYKFQLYCLFELNSDIFVFSFRKMHVFGRPALFIIRWQMASLPRRLPVRDGNRWLQRKCVNVCSLCPVLGSQRAISCCPICQERYIGPKWNHGKYKYFVFETDDESITIASLPILFLDRLQVTMNNELA